MKNLKIKKFVAGPIKTNVYLVFDEKTRKAFLVDCASSVDEYVDYIKENNLDVEFVVITHGHFDHIDGLDDFLSGFDVPFYISEKDSSMLADPTSNGSLVMGEVVVVNKRPEYLKSGQKIKFENKELEIIETPGHTQGGVSIKVDNWLFSGDTLFYHTIGRTDFLYSNTERLKDSIRKKLFTLDENIKVFPGHGRETTIKEEKENNIFM